MRVLITGASGMVGRNMLADPRAHDHELICPSRGELDLTDPGACNAFVAERRPDVVAHLASVVGGIQANIEEPVRFLTENVLIGTNLIMACVRADVPALLNVASSCMYPRDVDGLLSKDLLLSGPLEPTNEGYALAKLVSTRLTQYVRRERPDLAYKTLIPCNLYGRYDHFDAVRSHLVPAAIMKVVKAKATGGPVEVWGDGSARREFMFAADLASFVWNSIGAAATLPDLLNVGVGRDHTVREYYEAVAAVVGYRGEFTFDATKPSGMKAKLLDTSEQTALGWSPPTSLHDGLRQTVDYYLSLGEAGAG